MKAQACHLSGLSVYATIHKRLSLFQMHIHIDIVGTCNLRCPSCPVGNTSPSATVPSKKMSLELLAKILDKADREIGNYSVGFFNWTEPLLHPQLPLLCKEVKKRGRYLALSSNLNITRDYSEFLPYVDELCLSLSGFSQQVYAQTHTGGNIDKVKENMRKLSLARAQTRSNCMIYTRYIRYKHNLEEEQQVKAYVESLGFVHGACWAQLMPLEKQVAWLEGRKNDLTSQDIEIISNLAIDPVDFISLTSKYDHGSCHLRSDQITLDPDGNSILCCSVYEQSANSVGNFLDMNLEEMQQRRHQHSTCVQCMRLGAHRFSIPDHELSQRVDAKIEKILKKSLIAG